MELKLSCCFAEFGSPLLQGRTSTDNCPSAMLPDRTRSQVSASRAQGEMLGARGPQGVTGGTQRKLHCHTCHLNRHAHTGCYVACSVPPVTCLPVKGRPQTSVLLAEHMPGTYWRNHYRGHCRGVHGRKASGFSGTRKYILRWILKALVTRVRRRRWGKSLGTETGVGGTGGDCGDRSAELHGSGGQGALMSHTEACSRAIRMVFNSFHVFIPPHCLSGLYSAGTKLRHN